MGTIVLHSTTSGKGRAGPLQSMYFLTRKDVEVRLLGVIIHYKGLPSFCNIHNHLQRGVAYLGILLHYFISSTTKLFNSSRASGRFLRP